MGPRLYINGFPKSGLHLLWTWALPFVAEPAFTPKPWTGTFQGNAWTTKWVDLDNFEKRMEHLREGTYLKGHCGWSERIERFLWGSGVVHCFVYRDPRDVAVSQAYHILKADKEKDENGVILHHPGAEDIRTMAQGDFGHILAACIAGYGPWAGVIERWELYAGWLDCGWTLCLRFEDMRHKAYETAQLMIRYVYGRMAKVAGFNLGLYQQDLDRGTRDLLELADKNRKNSPTYRKGQTGGWREHFTPDHIDLWREHDPTDWVTRLGYSWGED